MIWAIVLIKDFGTAKRRLASALSPHARRQLARANARLALAAAGAADHVLAVCGSPAAGGLAASCGAEVLLEDMPRGQNQAARAGIARSLAGGASAVLILSSDLPLVTRAAISGLLAAARRLTAPAAMAAPAAGRGGTNGLYLSPPDAIRLHFGDDSLNKFAREARQRGVTFAHHDSDALALDVDVPADLEAVPRP
jgi:2-phospho-L-lactate guanylyltransferase